MFEAFHVDPLSGEFDSFQVQPRALLVSRGAAQLDLTAGAEDAVPGQLIEWVRPEKSSNGAVIARVARRSRNPAVRTHFSRRNGKNHAAEGDVSFLVRP